MIHSCHIHGEGITKRFDGVHSHTIEILPFPKLVDIVHVQWGKASVALLRPPTFLFKLSLKILTQYIGEKRQMEKEDPSAPKLFFWLRNLYNFSLMLFWPFDG